MSVHTQERCNCHYMFLMHDWLSLWWWDLCWFNSSFMYTWSTFYGVHIPHGFIPADILTWDLHNQRWRLWITRPWDKEFSIWMHSNRPNPNIPPANTSNCQLSIKKKTNLCLNVLPPCSPLAVGEMPDLMPVKKWDSSLWLISVGWLCLDFSVGISLTAKKSEWASAPLCLSSALFTNENHC